MNVKVFYDYYLTEDNKQIISGINANLFGDVGLNLKVNRDNIENPFCKVKMYDKIGVSEVESTLDKNELKELIALLRQIYNQL